MIKKTFRGQALAIVMVVLVVASIIGVSLFSRMAKENQSALNQQDSALAEEQSDAILDIFAGADIETLEEKIGEDVDGAIEFDSLSSSEFATFIDDIGGDPLALPDENFCSGGNSEIGITVTQTDMDDFLEVQTGSVRSYNFDGATVVDPCTLRVGFRAVSEASVFIVKFVRDDGSEMDQHYCITPDGTACSSVDNVEYLTEFLSSGNTLSWNAGDNAYYTWINFVNRVAQRVVEIRVLPLAGTLAVADHFSTDPNCIDREFRAIKITSEVNCNGSYRGKEIYLPGSGNLGYSTLFDYAIYDNGTFAL